MAADEPTSQPQAGHRAFNPTTAPEYQVCRYCIQPVTAPVCDVQPGNPERPPLNPAVNRYAAGPAA